jgi:hypothetical protein
VPEHVVSEGGPLDGFVLHTDGRPLAELDHLAQTHAGSREVCIMADRVHELSRLFPRHDGSACRGLAARSPWRGDKLASSGCVLASAQQKKDNLLSLVVCCTVASSGRVESESRMLEARPRHRPSPVAHSAPSPALKTSIAPSSFTCLHMPRLSNSRLFFVSSPHHPDYYTPSPLFVIYLFGETQPASSSCNNGWLAPVAVHLDVMNRHGRSRSPCCSADHVFTEALWTTIIRPRQAI